MSFNSYRPLPKPRGAHTRFYFEQVLGCLPNVNTIVNDQYHAVVYRKNPLQVLGIHACVGSSEEPISATEALRRVNCG